MIVTMVNVTIKIGVFWSILRLLVVVIAVVIIIW